VVGEHDRLHAIAEVELLQDVRDAGLDSRLGSSLAGGSNDVGDSSAADRRESLIFEQGAMCGALHRPVDAVPGQLREICLSCRPTTLLSDIPR
jgi:hypothetical protein